MGCSSSNSTETNDNERGEMWGPQGVNRSGPQGGNMGGPQGGNRGGPQGGNMGGKGQRGKGGQRGGEDE